MQVQELMLRNEETKDEMKRNFIKEQMLYQNTKMNLELTITEITSKYSKVAEELETIKNQ